MEDFAINISRIIWQSSSKLQSRGQINAWQSPYADTSWNANPEIKNSIAYLYITVSMRSRCLKTTEKVSFNIASEASYVYILSGQKLIKNAKNIPFWRVFENLKLAVKQCYQTGQISGKCQNSNATFRVIFKHCNMRSLVWIFSSDSFLFSSKDTKKSLKNHIELEKVLLATVPVVSSIVFHLHEFRFSTQQTKK